MFQDLAKMGQYLGQAARLMVGIPDYDTYVQHMRLHHPDQPIMTPKEFFYDRQNARYNSTKPGRCC